MTARRNRIKPVLMEALQILKFRLKKQRLNFMRGWRTDEATQKPIPDPDSALLNDLFNLKDDKELQQVVEALLEDDEDDVIDSN